MPCRAVARYLELLKLAALIERPSGQDLQDAIADLNWLLVAGRQPSAARGLRRVRPRRAPRDGAAREKTDRRELIKKRAEPSLEAFIPMRGDGVMLSATDIEIYRICPLRYKYARVYSIPREQTLQQRFGILVHQVLERFHGQLADEQASNGDSDEHLSTSRAPSACSPCSRTAGGDRASATRMASASFTRRRSRRSTAITTTSASRSRHRSGSSEASRSASAHTCCAAASTGSTATWMAPSS